MTQFGFFCEIFFLCFASVIPTSKTGVSQGNTVAGVFMLIEGDTYTFDYTSAKAACLLLNTTIATKAQMERAMRRGLETCKYGWVEEKFAVIPRITPNDKCGMGLRGVAVWYTLAMRKFAAFCFNATAFAEEKETALLTSTTSSPTTLTTTSSPTTLTTTLTTTSSPTTLTTTSSPTTLTTTLTTTSSPTTLTTTSSPTTLTTTSSPTTLTTTSSPTTLTTTLTTTSSPTTLTTTSSPTTTAFKLTTQQPLTTSQTNKETVSPVKYVLGAFNRWSAELQMDDAATEMWKHTNSYSDLETQHVEDDDYEESDRKYSSDITLCVNPDHETKCSEQL
ncbi:integumentary mucin C.1-like [Cynoglossus semilaevis]|uniref:integumentary mucin C.1-like n=1 Tax=Cynoglossus semilaevis TaxID=244447 RepID=UPI000D62B581|nr:integumentary mucin C.1-like [Cynoglossus semilaevis]